MRDSVPGTTPEHLLARDDAALKGYLEFAKRSPEHAAWLQGYVERWNEEWERIRKAFDEELVASQHTIDQLESRQVRTREDLEEG
jgi:hypothetical protein